MKYKIVSLLLAISLLSSLMVGFPLNATAEAIPANALLSRSAAAEGIVLLENDGVLPLKPAVNVAVFGYSRHMNGSSYPSDGFGKDGWITYGGGSGEVTAPYVVDLLQGLTNRKNEGLLQSVLDGGNSPSAATVNAAALTNDVAVVVIRRWTAEASDLSAGAGGYLLSSAETTTIERVNAAFDKVIVVMNMGNAIDMTWVEKYENISAVVVAWYPGMEGGNAVADMLCGVVNPSGKLVDTFARSISDYPSTATFANTNPQYTEDIYVGYRYFATADPNYEKVKYEFGYGLSYSTFAITEKTVALGGSGELVAKAKVTNNGPFPGKETLQAYFSPPAGVLNKPAFELAAFAKTSLLGVGESEIVEMRFPIASMASYDDVGKTGVISAYVMEAGDYNIYIGNSIKNATKSAAAGKYTQPSLAVTEQLEKRLAPATAFNRLIDPVNNTYQPTNWTPAGGAPTPGTPNPVPGPAVPVTRVPWAGSGTIMLEDVSKEPGYIYDFVAQMTDAELRTMCRHQGSSILPNGTGAIGKMAKYGIPEVNTADGPAGLRIGTIGARAILATCFPIGTMLACTWNTKIAEDVGAAVGAEMELNRVDIWLAPGMNIHRHPRNGRNFEYYSEDPLVTGKMAAGITKGVQARGGLVTLKHFAGNQQETNRYNTNSQISERALREIYLKGFEIAVKEADPGCVMTAYNLINGTRTEASYDLCTNILRNEWGFKGLVMTDWWNGRAQHAQEIAAGCNIKMDDADSSINNVSRSALEANIRVIMGPIMRSFAFAKEISPEPRITAIEINPQQITVGKAASIEVTVTGRNLGEKEVKTGIKGYPGTFVAVPGNTGGKVALSIASGLLPIGTYEVVVTLDGVESNVKTSLRVDVEKAYYYLVAERNGKVVGADPATFNSTGTMTTMVANLDEPNGFALFEILTPVQDRVHLLMMNGYLITMEGSSYGNQMVRPRTAPPASPTATGWEALIFDKQDDDTIKIRRVGTDGTWFVNVAANGNLSTVQNSVGDTGKFRLISYGAIEPEPTITSVEVSPPQINEGVAIDLKVTVAGKYLDESDVKVGIKGFADTFVSVPGSTGATVTVPIPAVLLAPGTYEIVVLVDNVQSAIKGSLLVISAELNLPKEGDTIYLIAQRNGKIVGSDPGTFEPPVTDAQLTMVANLDAASDYAKLEVTYKFGCVYLKAANGLYVSMEGQAYGNYKVRARTPDEGIAADGWEALQFEVQADNTIKIKRTNSFDGIRYVDVDANGNLSTVANNVGDTGKFKLVIMDSGDDPGPDPDPTKSTVKFDYNYLGAPANPPQIAVETGTAIGALPKPPNRPGTIFNGWVAYDGKTTVSGSNACLMPTYYTPETVISADTLLVANWSRVLRVDRDGSKATATAYLSNLTIKNSNSVIIAAAAYNATGQLLSTVLSDAFAVPTKKPLRLTQQVPTDVFGLDSATFDSKSITLDLPANVDKVKAFLWDANTMIPICAPIEPAKLNLIWSDEFEGTAIDTAKWVIPPDNGGGGNNEIQYYRPQNAEINKTDAGIAGSTNNSVLRIQAYRQTGLPRGSWASCKLTTEGLFSVQYGRIEARLKTPVNDQGFWPAFWMMPATSTYGGWANAGEIDIYENKSRQSGTVSSALHYGGSWAASNVMNATRNRYTTLRAGAADTVDGNIPVDTVIPGFNVGEWHIYAIEWYPDRIEYFVDGIRYQEINTWYTTVGGARLQQPAPLDKPFYLIFNLAVGGSFDGGRAPANTSIGNMYIDYVRVYQ
jgi:beta-glucosidase